LKKNKVSKNWIIKQHRDLYFKESKIKGYKSRSAFKLIEMNNKFKFIKKNSSLLDLGASPGGWSQVASKIITGGKIMAVDLKPMEKLNKVYFINKNMLDEKIDDKIYQYFGEKIDVVISDLAANTTGNKNLDSYKTGELCLEAMNIAKKFLKKDGVFLSKLFMGTIFFEIHEKAKKYFEKVIKYKPLSSKKESKEIYIYCQGISKI